MASDVREIRIQTVDDHALLRKGIAAVTSDCGVPVELVCCTADMARRGSKSYCRDMLNRRVLLESVGPFLAQAISLNAQHDGASKIVFKHELPEVTLKDWSVTAVEVSYAPGESSSAHRHPGITIGYVLQGEIRSKVGDEPEQTYTAGQMFLETPGQLHAVSRNAGPKPAKLLALLLAETGKQLTTPA
jgi:quercetin dioxygenase-like cupin family protein